MRHDFTGSSAGWSLRRGRNSLPAHYKDLKTAIILDDYPYQAVVLEAKKCRLTDKTRLEWVVLTELPFLVQGENEYAITFLDKKGDPFTAIVGSGFYKRHCNQPSWGFLANDSLRQPA